MSARSYWVAASLSAGLLCSCGSAPGGASLEDAQFAGLDPALVSEVTVNKVALANVAMLDVSDRASMWQGMVENFELCRAWYGFYASWMDQGVQPAELPRPTRPTNPEPSYSDVEAVYKFYGKLASSGDPNLLRDGLTAETSCGTWVPVSASDAKTIAEAVKLVG